MDSSDLVVRRFRADKGAARILGTTPLASQNDEGVVRRIRADKGGTLNLETTRRR